MSAEIQLSLSSSFNADSNTNTHVQGSGTQQPSLAPLSLEQSLEDFDLGHYSRQAYSLTQLSPLPAQPGVQSPHSPSQSLPVSLKRKQKRPTSPEPAVGDGCGEPNQTTGTDPSPAVKFTGPRSTAYDIWLFVRALATNVDNRSNKWLDDYDQHLTRRPDTKFIGCKFCTKFGNKHGNKLWKVFSNSSKNSPTSTIRRHFEREHAKIWKSELSRLKVPKTSTTEQAVSGWSGEPFSREGIAEHLQQFIVSDDQALYLIENTYFRQLLLYFGQGRVADDEIPGRTSLTGGIIKAWREEREKFHQEMKKALGRISLTTDVWSDPELSSFLAATAHFVVRERDEPGGPLVLRSGLLAFRRIYGSHTGKYLSCVLYGIIKEAGIEQKVGSITADNASNNDTMMEHLEGLFAKDGILFNRHGNRVRCFPHVINLAVQAIYATLKDGTHLEEQYTPAHINAIDEAMANLPEGVTRDDYARALKADVLGTTRKLVATCRISGKRREEFADLVLKCDIERVISKKAVQLLRDCDTRWSSTHNMVDRVLIMLPAIKLFAKHQSQSDVKIAVPTVAEVCLLDHVRVVMSVPHAAQESLSSQRTPTLSYSLPFYYSIVDKWDNLRDTYPLLSPHITVGVQKVKEYINKSKLSRTYLLAVLLNPCLKMKWIEAHCSADDVRKTEQMALDAMFSFKIADLEAQQETAYAYTAAPAHHLKSITASAVQFLGHSVRQTNLQDRPMDVTSLGSASRANVGGRDAVLDGLRVELISYIYEPLIASVRDTNQGTRWCDPLLYWAGSERRFPYLFRLAMDILPAQASSVPCEQLFSSSKETCTPRRNRIGPELMEALQTLKFSFRSTALDLNKSMDDPVSLSWNDCV